MRLLTALAVTVVSIAITVGVVVVFFFFFWGALFIGGYQGIISIYPWEKTKKKKGQKLVTSSKEKKIQG